MTPQSAAILVIGATGFIGSKLVASLLLDGREVIALSRDAAKARRKLGAGVRVVESLDAIDAATPIEAIVNLAGAPVLGMPWTAGRRRELLASRAGPAAAALALVRRLKVAPSVLVAASAVGFYGATPGASFEPRDEASLPRPGEFQSDLCAAVEREASAAEALGLRVVRLRFAVVMGRGGGAYPMLSPGARLGFGAVLGSGLQPAPWVHLDDAVGLVRWAIFTPSLSGALNVVAPDVRSQAEFEAVLAGSFGRKVRLRLPGFLLRGLGEMSALLLDGQNAVPRLALDSGYSFVFPRLEGALGDLA